MVATQTSTHEVCDRCLNPRRKSLKTYHIGHDGINVRIVLCKEHAAIADELISRGQLIPSASPQVKVWSWEEILARKQESQKRKTPPTR